MQLRHKPVALILTRRNLPALDRGQQRPADRALAPEKADVAFPENTVEMMDVKEEAEVRKEARVAGEVAVVKESAARDETIRDTFRKTDVDVEEIDAASKKRK